MEDYQTIINTIGLTMGASWASGINLYAALLVLGLGGSTGYVDLPETMHVVQNPLVIGAAGIMYSIEFVADKIPGVDTAWDTVQTFVRIPAGAFLASTAVGDMGPSGQVLAGAIGGSMAATSHATKAGSRVLINTSPEPVTNWTMSLAEDFTVVAGLWTALNYPWVFVILLICFIALAIWLLPKIWRGIKSVARTIGGWLGIVEPLPEEAEEASSSPATSDAKLDQISKLKTLHNEGALTDEEFEREKKKLLGDE